MRIELGGRTVTMATGGRPVEGHEPAVVFVHGAGGDRTTWQLQTRWFAHHGFRAVALDLPGHGGSDGPPLRSVGEVAEWLAEVVDALDLAPAHVVGHSMGSLVGLEIAATRPDLVRSLVLIGTAASMPVHPDLLAAAAADDPLAGELIVGWGVGARAHRGGHPSPGTWLVGATRAQIDRTPAGTLAVDLEAAQAYADAVRRAAAVTCPVTLLLGREDKMTPNRAATDLIDALADAETLYLDDIGHFVPVESPDVTRQVIADAVGAASQ